MTVVSTSVLSTSFCQNTEFLYGTVEGWLSSSGFKGMLVDRNSCQWAFNITGWKFQESFFMGREGWQLELDDTEVEAPIQPWILTFCIPEISPVLGI